MKWYYILMVIAIFLSPVLLVYISDNEKGDKMELTSDAFENNGMIASKYTCDGDNTNPPLTFSDIPEETKSLVLIMDDPDAVKPAGKVWDHWIVFNMSPEVREIEEGKEPEGIHGKGTRGNLNYSGPCPPDTEHTYVFKLYALDTELDLKEGATKNEVEGLIEGHVIESAQLLGRYERQ